MGPVLKQLLLAAAFALCYPAVAQTQSREIETLFYMRNNEPAFESFRANIAKISIVGPQVYSVEGDGVVWGQVDPRVLTLAKEHGVKVMPLIHNPGFNQETIHELLHDEEARRRSIAMMVELAERHGFWGWQFDFENFHITDRDAMTQYYSETAEALHTAGFTISIAVVPSLGTAGRSPFHRYMEANWRGTFDLKAMAEVSDFISYMTYAQHGGPTTPGPIAGLPCLSRKSRSAFQRSLVTGSRRMRMGWLVCRATRHTGTAPPASSHRTMPNRA